jgi:large repetitive protein
LFFTSIIKKTIYMSKKLFIGFTSILLVSFSAYFISCSKPNTDPPVVTCADKTIVIAGTTINTSGGTSTNGSITVSATGSNGFTYNINGGAFQSTGTFNGLAAGTYSIVAKDDAGCTNTNSFVVSATACPTINITAVLTQASSSTAANGAINATATGSTGITYSLGTGAFQTSGNFTGLVANTYSITAKDVNGCTSSANFTVTAASCPTITVSTSTTPSAGPTATNGSINITSTNGGASPYTYSLNGGAFQGAGVTVFNNLLAGNYTVVAKDANGCLSASTPVVVSSAPCPTITINTTVVGSELCAPTNVGQITVNASGSTGFMYKEGTNAYQSSNIFNSLIAGSYNISVRDANGCEKTSSVTVSNLPQGPLFTNVKAVLATNCAFAGCHGGATPQSGINFADNCTIVAQKVRINARAVVAGTMPPSGAISAADKQKITDWINAGGKFSN